jgi:nitrilase
MPKMTSALTSRVAAIQMSSGGQIDSNLEMTQNLIKQAVEQGAELVVLPENFALMASDKLFAAGKNEMTERGPIRQFVSSLAKQHNVWIIAGSIPVAIDIAKEAIDLQTNTGTNIENPAGKVHAACFVYDNRGKQVARYNKIHLFDVEVDDAQGRYRESDVIEPGSKVVTVDTPVGRVGLSICYDLRFPELYRLLADQGAEIYTVPSAFTATTGAAHWHSLLRARAIENIGYLVAPNQSGIHSKNRESYGHSMIVDPWGKVLKELAEGQGVVLADVDLPYLRSLRARMPIQQHRFFKQISSR